MKSYLKTENKTEIEGQRLALLKGLAEHITPKTFCREEKKLQKIVNNYSTFAIARQLHMQLSEKIYGHIAAFSAYAIFGINIIICKDLANSAILSPFALFTARAIGATILFWAVSLFMPKEKVDKKDYPKIFMASMLGLYLTQLVFLKGITMASPLDCAILTTLSPIFTMLIAAIAIKEPITLKKAGGVMLSFAGIIFLILNSMYAKGGDVQTPPLGYILLILNGLCFATYLGVFKPLISKYSVVTFMKWMFLFSLIMSLPFTFGELTSCNYAQIPARQIMNLAFLIIMSTFVAYYLVPVGQKRLRPTVVSLYSYLQPIIAATASIIIGMDTIGWQKIVAVVVVITGIVLVNKSKSREK